MSTTWDYRTLEGTPDPTGMLTACQQEGRNGWELCDSLLVIKDPAAGMVIKGVGPPRPVVILTFKRPIGWESPAGDPADEQTPADAAAELEPAGA